jgi:hypothetical protein
MKDVTTGTDTREPRPVAEALATFDLPGELDQLAAEPAWAEYGRTSKTLMKTPHLRLVLTLLRAGGSIGEDDVWAPIGVEVLSGEIRATQATDDVTVRPLGLTVFREGPGWRVTATRDSALLLVISWSPERTVEPSFV